ncbi:hypothetical protein L208DRAFT_555185 [Tricholoma matsutake]|nr:hypothetical protein L208DRAFT_555185 [Tricholoma matsutake 945]
MAFMSSNCVALLSRHSRRYSPCTYLPLLTTLPHIVATRSYLKSRFSAVTVCSSFLVTLCHCRTQICYCALALLCVNYHL